MSAEYYNYTASDDFPAKKKSAGKIEKGVKKLIIAAVIILIAQLIWLFGISPFIPFSTIDVNGFSPLHRSEILSLAGINETSSFFTTNTKEIHDRLSSHILVESAIVMKRFPDRLTVFLTPREAAAVTLMTMGSRQVPVYIDRHGVLFKTGDVSSVDGLDIPVISGIENIHLNMRLPLSLVPLFENLKKMALSSPELLSAISEIRIEPKTWDGYELVLFPVHSSIRVRVENNLTEDILRYMLLMLNVFENDIQKPHEIDFRSGMGSYRVKEYS